MTSISSLLSSSSSSSSYSSSGITGLATGMDTDELINGMTIGTRSKIARQKQNKTLLSWKTDAYRAISDKLIGFADKYTSYSSSTNLYSSGFYGKNLITATGANSKYVSVSGTASSGQQLAIEGVKQLAKEASFTTSEALSNNDIETVPIEFGSAICCTLADKSFTVKYGNGIYSVTMPPKTGGGIYANAAEVADGITKAMQDVEIDNGKKLSEVMSVTANGEKLNFKNIDGIGNKLEIVGGDAELMYSLGLSSGAGSVIDKGITATGLDGYEDINADNLKVNATFIERLKGKSLSFEYNGVRKKIIFNDETKLDEAHFKDYLQSELDSAFGKGRIGVSQDGEKKLAFETFLPTDPPFSTKDESSVLYISSSSTGLMGEGSLLGISSGSTNKLNLNCALEDAGIKDAESVSLVDGTEYEIRINGESIKFTYKKGETSLTDIMSLVNSNENADVKMSYQTNSDAVSIISTQQGASGSVKIGDATGELNDVERLLFGKRVDGKIVPGSKDLNGTLTAGQDAVILVDYDGDGGASPMEISRGTNSFSLNGMKVVVNGTFGYEKNGSGVLEPIAGTEAVKFSASVNTDKVVEAVKSMIDEYNELVKASNTSVKEKRDRNYMPLTDEQKKDMSDTEEANWEKKAKVGMLFGDSDIVSLTNDLRYTFLDSKAEGLSLADIGITVTSDWEDNGKIVLDESKLKNALLEDPDRVKDLFTAEGTKGSMLTTGGIMSRMKTITDKYAKTTGATKGSLIEKAGNAKSPSSLLKNSLLTQMDDIDDLVDTLGDRLKSERTRYQKKFTALEQLTQKMNSQSGWLSNISGS